LQDKRRKTGTVVAQV